MGYYGLLTHTAGHTHPLAPKRAAAATSAHTQRTQLALRPHRTPHRAPRHATHRQRSQRVEDNNPPTDRADAPPRHTHTLKRRAYELYELQKSMPWS